MPPSNPAPVSNPYDGAVENPIINSPYERPDHYWQIERGQQPRLVEGRREAAYYFRVPERAARGRRRLTPQTQELFAQEDKGEIYPLDLVNNIRPRLKDWLDPANPRRLSGATRVTKELVDLWTDPERYPKLFFAQVEAALTVIFLAEATPDFTQGISVPLDQPGAQAQERGTRAFSRQCCKMATGSGKTTVMGMLAAWSILNKVNDPHSTKHCDTVLILCPNVTIRERLAELDPNRGEHSLYRTRNLVPSARMDELRRGVVLISNWHKLEKRELNTVNGVSARVVKRGVPVKRIETIKITAETDGENGKGLSEEEYRRQVALGILIPKREEPDRHGRLARVEVESVRYVESDAKWLDRLLSGRKGHTSLLVMNDEAHHAYRRGDTADNDDPDVREATVWIEGLDRIHRLAASKKNQGIRLCVDLSATPFYLQGSGNETGRPFPWVVSDFSLLEAIESGLVKIPQLPAQDATGGPPPYFNIWRWVEEQLEADGIGGATTADKVLRYATMPLVQLTASWEQTMKEWQTWHQRHCAAGYDGDFVPPVMIVVCNDIKLAKIVYEFLALGSQLHGVAPPGCFRNAPGREWAVRVDNQAALDSGEGGDEGVRLRYLLATVGKSRWPGGIVPDEYAQAVERINRKHIDEDGWVPIDPKIPPGRDVRCIVSVNMLTEGWDATTVSHILGLRPFGSQLLCEQVIGRALRRASYDVIPKTGMFAEESAQVFGVPFELIPIKVIPPERPPPTPNPTHIYAVPEKAKEFEISFPVVQGYQVIGSTDVKMDWTRVPELKVDPTRVPNSVLLQNLASQDGSLVAYTPGRPTVLTLDDFRSKIRVQNVAFILANRLTHEWQPEGSQDEYARHRTFMRMLGFSREFLATRVTTLGDAKPQDIGINPYFSEAVNALLRGLTPVSDSGDVVEVPIIPTGQVGWRTTATVDFYTVRDIVLSRHCHLNAMPGDKKWERGAAFVLDQHSMVTRWVKNDHLGFVIRYRDDGGQEHSYIPDFLVALKSHAPDDGMLIVEIKGRVFPTDNIKWSAARKWVDAVNRVGRYGHWDFCVVRHAAGLSELLAEKTGQALISTGQSDDLFAEKEPL